MLNPIGFISLGTREPVWLLAVTLLDGDRVRLTLSRGHTYTRVVTALGWAAIRRELVAVE